LVMEPLVYVTCRIPEAGLNILQGGKPLNMVNAAVIKGQIRSPGARNRLPASGKCRQPCCVHGIHEEIGKQTRNNCGKIMKIMREGY